MPLILLASLLFTWLNIASHNFVHCRYNVRIFYHNLSLIGYQDIRVSHALSHHLYPNSLNNMEMYLFDPLICYFPNGELKGVIKRYASWFYAPILWAGLLFLASIARYVME